MKVSRVVALTVGIFLAGSGLDRIHAAEAGASLPSCAQAVLQSAGFQGADTVPPPSSVPNVTGSTIHQDVRTSGQGNEAQAVDPAADPVKVKVALAAYTKEILGHTDSGVFDGAAAQQLGLQAGAADLAVKGLGLKWPSGEQRGFDVTTIRGGEQPDIIFVSLTSDRSILKAYLTNSSAQLEAAALHDPQGAHRIGGTDVQKEFDYLLAFWVRRYYKTHPDAK